MACTPILEGRHDGLHHGNETGRMYSGLYAFPKALRLVRGTRLYFKTQLCLLLDMLASVEHLWHCCKHSRNSDAMLYMLDAYHAPGICLIVLPISSLVTLYLLCEVGDVTPIHRREL